jgi:hypothetical protein
MLKPCDRNIQKTIQLTRAMIRLADKGDADREDTGCGILYGILRDAAYKLRRLAEEEKNASGKRVQIVFATAESTGLRRRN